MTLKKALWLPLALTVILFAIFSPEIAKSYITLERVVSFSPSFVVAVVCAVLLQFIGHWVRAYKMRFILEPVKQGTTKFQFRALSLGYLFNTLFPLRLGEIIRSYVIATGEKMSWGLSLMLVLFERAIDALILLGGLGVLSSLGWIRPQAVWIVAVSLIIFAVIIFGSIWLAVKENKLLISAIHRLSGLFNKKVRLQFRFKAWSIMYGLQRVMGVPRIWRYVGLSAASWVFYAASMALIAAQFNGVSGNLQALTLASVSPYYGVAIPAGPAGLGAYSAAANAVNGRVGWSTDERTTANLVSWAVLVLPICAVAAVLFFVKTPEPLQRKLRTASSSNALVDKLAREEDISGDMEAFLDNYFSGNPLSKIVHRLEQQGALHLLKYFKGGSDAITILAASEDGKIVVKKIISAAYKDRLKAQHDWLKRHQAAGIVRATRELTGDDYYMIDLDYDDANEMFFDYLHTSTAEENERIIREVWNILHKTLYKTTQMVTDYDSLDAYVTKHIWGCLATAADANGDIAKVVKRKKVWINGREYDNIHEVMKKIMENKDARKDLATYSRAEEVDGDIALDNILVSRRTGKPLVIDPAPDGNIINGPVFDFGKNMQSLYCGYEFLFRSDEKVELGAKGEINFQDRRSGQYIALCEYVRNTLAKEYLSKGEQKAIIFHAAALHIRRLKHQVKQNPDIALAMYAVGVRTLNDFLEQY